ncbi:MAG: Do family serine endopeptidase [Alphaproteobacteria bacterium]
MLNIPMLYDNKPEGQTPSRGFRAKSTTAVITAACLSLALLAIPGQMLIQAQPAAAQTNRAPASFADVAEKVRPAVVSVYTKTTSPKPKHGKRHWRGFRLPEVPQDNPFHDFFERFRKQFPDQTPPHAERAQGSGFLISEDGYVVTNHHVVNKATEIKVSFGDDEKLKAKVVGSDQRTDIALLKIEGKRKFKAHLTFAKTPSRVGDWVLAVGNPFGLGGTVTAGIVSAGGRSIGHGPYDFLQIDAAVNRGNSGGPAVNLNGEVIGVNTAIYSPSGGNVGIAFAIPAKLVETVVAQLKDKGKVNRGWLGVTIQNVSKGIADSLGIKDTKGAMISKILKDGPSAKSELRARDIITDVNGLKIENSRDLARKIADIQPGTSVKLIVIRDGKEKTLTIKLGTFPGSEKLAAMDTGQGGNTENSAVSVEELGLRLAPSREVEGAGDEGVAVMDVDPSSEAADKGMSAGDIILDVNGKLVSRPSDVAKGIHDAQAKGRKAVLFQVRSRRGTHFIALSIEKKG